MRLSGQCGRLKCCLNYELEQYMQALAAFPGVNTPVVTSYGRGTVQKLDIFKNLVWIQYEDGTWEDRPLEEIRALVGGKETSTQATGARPSGARRKAPKRSRRRGSNRRRGGKPPPPEE